MKTELQFKKGDIVLVDHPRYRGHGRVRKVRQWTVWAGREMTPTYSTPTLIVEISGDLWVEIEFEHATKVEPTVPFVDGPVLRRLDNPDSEDHGDIVRCANSADCNSWGPMVLTKLNYSHGDTRPLPKLKL